MNITIWQYQPQSSKYFGRIQRLSIVNGKDLLGIFTESLGKLGFTTAQSITSERILQAPVAWSELDRGNQLGLVIQLNPVVRHGSIQRKKEQKAKELRALAFHSRKERNNSSRVLPCCLIFATTWRSALIGSMFHTWQLSNNIPWVTTLFLFKISRIWNSLRHWTIFDTGIDGRSVILHQLKCVYNKLQTCSRKIHLQRRHGNKWQGMFLSAVGCRHNY
jgi:hypothetical protein